MKTKTEEIKKCKHTKTTHRFKVYQKYVIEAGYAPLPVDEEWLEFICLKCGGIVRQQKIFDLCQNGG